jgi:hypothetical protein
VGADQAILPPMPDRVYRDAASLGHFRDGAHTAFPEPVESALESVTDVAGRSGVRPDCPFSRCESSRNGPKQESAKCRSAQDRVGWSRLVSDADPRFES